MNPKYADRRLDRHVIADRGLPDELMPEFEKYASGRIGLFLSDLDNWLASRTIDDGADSDRIDAGVNVFLYVQPTDEEAPASGLARASESKRSRDR